MAYSAEESPQAAVRILDALLAAAGSLATLSERGRTVPELVVPDIREIFVFRYRLIYRIESSRVVIVAFLHEARDFATWRQSQNRM